MWLSLPPLPALNSEETFKGKTVKSEIEAITIKKEEATKNKKTKKQIYAHPRTNFILATYYKGTGLEEVTKKLEEYLDDADKTESNINCI